MRKPAVFLLTYFIVSAPTTLAADQRTFSSGSPPPYNPLSNYKEDRNPEDDRKLGLVNAVREGSAVGRAGERLPNAFGKRTSRLATPDIRFTRRMLTNNMDGGEIVVGSTMRAGDIIRPSRPGPVATLLGPVHLVLWVMFAPLRLLLNWGSFLKELARLICNFLPRALFMSIWFGWLGLLSGGLIGLVKLVQEGRTPEITYVTTKAANQLQLMRCAARHLSVPWTFKMTANDLNRAFRQFSLTHHPDKNRGADPKLFLCVSEAKEFLTKGSTATLQRWGAFTPILGCHPLILIPLTYAIVCTIMYIWRPPILLASRKPAQAQPAHIPAAIHAQPAYQSPPRIRD